jgi:hypothetical protein
VRRLHSSGRSLRRAETERRRARASRLSVLCKIKNPNSFRARINAQVNSDRDYLYSFMRHWLSAFIQDHDPALAARLPHRYQIGEPLA